MKVYLVLMLRKKDPVPVPEIDMEVFSSMELAEKYIERHGEELTKHGVHYRIWERGIDDGTVLWFKGE